MNSDVEKDKLEWLNAYLASSEGLRAAEIADAAICFSLAIDLLLQARGMTRSDLARSLGVHRSVVTRRLASGSDIRLSSMVEMLHALGINMSDYFKEVAAEVQGSGIGAGRRSNVIPFRPRSAWREAPPTGTQAA